MKDITNILIISCFCLGWVSLLRPGMLLDVVGEWLERLPSWVNKPLGLCVPCSASIPGTIGYLLVMSGSYSLRTWVIYILAAVFVNQLLYWLMAMAYERTEDIRFIRRLRSQQHTQPVQQPYNAANQSINCNKCGNGNENKSGTVEERRQ